MGIPKETFEELYKNCFTPVYRYAYARLGHREAAEDIAQIVFSKAWETRDRYEDRGKPPLAYLFTIARNSIIDRLRRKEPLVMSDIEISSLKIQDDTNDPARMSQQAESSRFIQAALADLPEDQREAVLLRYIADLPYSEIADILDKNEEAVRKTVSRALQLLRDKHKP